MRQREENLSNSGRGHKPKALVELLQLYEGADCHDPRDKVFGLLGLAMACCKSAIEIHYESSAVSLYRQILEHEISHHGLNSETTLLDLSHGIRRILRVTDSPQRAFSSSQIRRWLIYVALSSHFGARGRFYTLWNIRLET